MKERFHVEVRMALEYLMDSRMRASIQPEILSNIEWRTIVPNRSDVVVRMIGAVDARRITYKL